MVLRAPAIEKAIDEVRGGRQGGGRRVPRKNRQALEKYSIGPDRGAPTQGKLEFR